MTRGATVVVVGAGGNIGSHLVPHLARSPEIAHLVLIDRDVYEERNIGGQRIKARSVSRKKAVVQAREAQAINPRMRITAVAEDVEDLPLGALRGDVILACLDSRRARQAVNQAARRLGVPWIDGGVLGEAMLARVDVYLPAADAPCLECGWDERDYAAIEQRYPCAANGQAPPATGAPSALGGLTAALQAIECTKLLAGEVNGDGMQVVLDAGHHRHYLTARRRNPTCRLGDHAAWAIERLPTEPRDLTLGDAFDLAHRRLGGNATEGAALWIDGKRFVHRLTCSECGYARRLLRLAAALRPGQVRCPRCGDVLSAAGFGMLEQLEWARLTQCQRGTSLRRLGLRAGEVVTIGSQVSELHLEIGTARLAVGRAGRRVAAEERSGHDA